MLPDTITKGQSGSNKKTIATKKPKQIMMPQIWLTKTECKNR